MQIKNLMSEDLITVDKYQKLSDGLKLLAKNDVSRLPVINTNKDLQNMKICPHQDFIFHLLWLKM